MERIQVLLDKLYQQNQQNAPATQLLITVQMLQSELISQVQKSNTLGTAKVAVTLPVNYGISVEQPAPRQEPVRQVVTETPVPVREEPKPLVAEQKEEQPLSHSPYMLRKPSFHEDPLPKAEPQPEEQKAPQPEPARPVPTQTNFFGSYDIPNEAPTLSQHQPAREVHQLIMDQQPSLNDRLKQEKTEVVQVLKDSPIKDLRKGIGINDRFLFVNELFRGDDAMYERSIRTINNFNIFSEAEYWISRELKYKLGWDESKETVQHFYGLVRRRFS
jgi:hypothetical protein